MNNRTSFFLLVHYLVRVYTQDWEKSIEIWKAFHELLWPAAIAYAVLGNFSRLVSLFEHVTLRAMETTRDLLDLATEYHTALPGRIRQYIYRRGIPDLLIDFHLLGWNGSRITIPIFNRQGELAFFKLARDPEDRLPGPKMMTTHGAYAELYGWGEALKKPPQIIICEGEFDRLVLEAKGFTAVTSTGGAGVFRSEWADELASIPELYICFDNDEAG